MACDSTKFGDAVTKWLLGLGGTITPLDFEIKIGTYDGSTFTAVQTKSLGAVWEECRPYTYRYPSKIKFEISSEVTITRIGLFFNGFLFSSIGYVYNSQDGLFRSGDVIVVNNIISGSWDWQSMVPSALSPKKHLHSALGQYFYQGTGFSLSSPKIVWTDSGGTVLASFIISPLTEDAAFSGCRGINTVELTGPAIPDNTGGYRYIDIGGAIYHINSCPWGCDTCDCNVYFLKNQIWLQPGG